MGDTFHPNTLIRSGDPLLDKYKPMVACLYLEYLAELMAIQGRLPGEGTFEERFKAEWEADNTSWHLLYDGDILCGFVVTGTFPNCHPAADYYIEEAYVSPMHRRRGLVKNFLLTHMKEFGGSVYCLFVLTKNKEAACFWDHVFSVAGYETVGLSEVAAPEPLLVQKGYRAKQKRRKGWVL